MLRVGQANLSFGVGTSEESSEDTERMEVGVVGTRQRFVTNMSLGSVSKSLGAVTSLS